MMDKKSELKRGLEDLIQEAREICKLAIELDVPRFGMEYQFQRY